MPVLALLLTCSMPLGTFLSLSDFRVSNESGPLHPRHPRVLLWQVRGGACSTTKPRRRTPLWLSRLPGRLQASGQTPQK